MSRQNHKKLPVVCQMKYECQWCQSLDRAGKKSKTFSQIPEKCEPEIRNFCLLKKMIILRKYRILQFWTQGNMLRLESLTLWCIQTVYFHLISLELIEVKCNGRLSRNRDVHWGTWPESHQSKNGRSLRVSLAIIGSWIILLIEVIWHHEVVFS